MASPPSQAPISSSIPVGMVSRSVFDTHVAEQKRELALLNQQISGGGYTIMGHTFFLSEYSVAFGSSPLVMGSYVYVS